MRKVLCCCLAIFGCDSNPTSPIPDLSMMMSPDDLAGADLSGEKPDLAMMASGDLAGTDSGGGGGPGTVTVHVYDQLDRADVGFVMFQDGKGAWTALAHQASGSYVLNVTDAQGRYGFAAGDPASIAGSPVGFFLQATVADGLDLTVRLGPEKPTLSKSVTVTSTNVPATHAALVQIGPYDFLNMASPGGTKMLNIAAGTYEVYGQVVNSTANGSSAGSVIHRRSFDATVASPSPAPFDFSSGEVVTPQSNTLSVSGAPANAPMGASSGLTLHTTLRRNPEYNLFLQNSGLSADGSGNASVSVLFLPDASVVAADLQYVVASATIGTAVVYAQSWFNLGANKSLTLPAPFNFTAWSWVARLPHAEWSAISNLSAYFIDWTAGNMNANTLEWYTFVTPAWLGNGAPSFSFPDLSGVSGWDNALMPSAGSVATYQGTAISYGGLDKVFTHLLGGAYKPQAGDSLRKSRSQNFTGPVQ